MSSTPGKGFIHRATFLRNWNNGAVNPALVKAMCASSIAFVSKDDESRTTAQKWMDEAERYVWQSLSRPSAVLVEILLVIVFYRFEHREYFKSQALTAVAAKMAFVLGLNYENNSLSTLVRECRRRLMWSIFHVDRLSAGGFPELLVCPSHSMHIQLPCSEKDFDLGIPGETAPLIPTRTNESESMHLGLRTFYFRISDIRHRILEYASCLRYFIFEFTADGHSSRYTRNLIREKSNPYDSQDMLRKLEAELDQLRSSLPANLQYNEDNLFLRAYSPQLTRFVMFHVLWQQCHTDLYRFMFPGTKDSISDTILENIPQEYVKYCQRKAFEHAVTMLDICHTVQSIGHTLISDTGIATCVYQCSNIIIRSADIVGFSSEEERVRIMGRLEKVTDILEGLREVNTHVDDVVSLSLIHFSRYRGSCTRTDIKNVIVPQRQRNSSPLHHHASSPPLHNPRSRRLKPLSLQCRGNTRHHLTRPHPICKWPQHTTTPRSPKPQSKWSSLPHDRKCYDLELVGYW